MDRKSENEALHRQEQTLKQQVQGDVRRQSQDVQNLVDIQTKEQEQAQSTESRLLQQKETLESELRDVSTEYNSQTFENSKLRSTIVIQSSECLAFDSENRAITSNIERTEGVIGQRESTIAGLERCVHDMESLRDELGRRIKGDELTRTKLYSTITDLRGNARVFCRVLPFSTTITSKEANIRYPDFEEREIEIVVDSRAEATLDKGPIAKLAMAPAKSAKLTGSSPHTDQCVFPFQFDHVFQPQSTLEQVYSHIVPTIEHALAGSPVTIFGYGLLQSDKSFTLEAGLVPLVVQDVCQRCQELERTIGWKYTVALQQLGIADEVLYDLLTESEAQGPDTTMESPKHYDNTLLEIQHGTDGTTTVSGLSTVILNHNSFSMETVASLLEKASRVRSTVSKSSECHSIYMLHISGKRKDSNSLKEESMSALLSLVELAGSARSSGLDTGRPGASSLLPTFTQRNDAKHDLNNKDQSLTCLMQVLFALSNKDSRIPFRNSKLTNLLQHSLAPESLNPGRSGTTPKILLIAHISPLNSQVAETLSTLRVAAKINACVFGASGGNGSNGSSNGSNTSTPSLGTSKIRRAANVNFALRSWILGIFSESPQESLQALTVSPGLFGQMLIHSPARNPANTCTDARYSCNGSANGDP
ncbi:kinesin-like nuclear fusion protein [Podila clonocystis]|nr:kinesin-like nuclear fusion protein [Podila clonocystis]